MVSRVCLTAAGFILSLTAAPWAAGAAEGEKNAYLTSTWRLAISAYPPELDGTLRIDPAIGQGTGTSLSVDRELGLDTKDVVPRVDLTWRLTPHHRFQFNYFQLDRDASRTFSEQVTFGEQTFDVNASLKASLDYKLGQLLYGWSFVNDGRKEFGVSLGAQFIGVDAELRGLAGGREAVRAADTKVGAPLLGLYGAYAFTPELALAAHGQWLELSWDKYDVSLLQLALELDWRFSKWAGLNAGYNFQNSELIVDSGDFRGDAELDLRGPRIGVSFYF